MPAALSRRLRWCSSGELTPRWRYGNVAPQLRDDGKAAPLRLGMVGGGNDAFIGGVHRMAARLDDAWQLVAGALSSTPERSLASATSSPTGNRRSARIESMVSPTAPVAPTTATLN